MASRKFRKSVVRTPDWRASRPDWDVRIKELQTWSKRSRRLLQRRMVNVRVRARTRRSGGGIELAVTTFPR